MLLFVIVPLIVPPDGVAPSPPAASTWITPASVVNRARLWNVLPRAPAPPIVKFRWPSWLFAKYNVLLPSTVGGLPLGVASIRVMEVVALHDSPDRARAIVHNLRGVLIYQRVFAVGQIDLA